MVIQTLLGNEQDLLRRELPLFSLRTCKLVVQSFRLDLLYPLIMPAVGIAAIATLLEKNPGERDVSKFASPLHFQAFMTVAVCALVCLIICLTIGRAQPVSFHRYSTFAVPIIILMGVVLWNMAIPAPGSPVARIFEDRWTPLAIVGCCLFVIVVDIRLYRHRDVLTKPLEYAAGAISIDDAYVTQGSWSYHMPWGAIYPAAREAYAIVGPHTPIWSLHVHSYCMLPDCRMETLHVVQHDTQMGPGHVRLGRRSAAGASACRHQLLSVFQLNP